MKKMIKPILALSALILFLLSINAAVRPFFGVARGNEWDAFFNVPPFREVTMNEDAGDAALKAPMSNDPGGNNDESRAGGQNLGVSAGLKDCASLESLPILSALLALLFVYAVLRVARHRGRPLFTHKILTRLRKVN